MKGRKGRIKRTGRKGCKGRRGRIDQLVRKVGQVGQVRVRVKVGPNVEKENKDGRRTVREVREDGSHDSC